MEQSTNTRWVSWIIDAAGIGLCVAASIAVYALGIAPLVEEQVSVVSQGQQLQAQRTTCAEVEASVKRLESQLAAAQAQLAEGQIRLEPPSRTNERVAALAGLLGDHGLEIDDVQIGAALPSSRCTVVPISIAGRGGYQRSVTLLRELIRTFADTSLAKLELVGNPAASGQPLKFRLDMLWYTSPELQASAP
jgi:multidrug efflux pump subunit AcrA (membrane-fusion protein)